MSCGCNNEEKILIPVATSCAQAQLDSPPCDSQSGKFYDKSIEDFTVPGVGKIANLHVCQANLWGVGQYVGIVIGKSKYGFYKITEVGERILKVLNGCEKGNTVNKVAGNPEPGVVIPEGSVVFPAPPFGCSEYLKEQFSSLLEGDAGVDGVIKILNESDEICFFSTPEIETDAEVKDSFLFGGRWLNGCLVKLKKIFTGQGGKTICMPEAQSTNELSVTVDGVLKHKHIAYFDENGCLKKGKIAECVINDRRTFKIINQTIYNGLSQTVTVTNLSLSTPAPHVCSNENVYMELEAIINIAGGGAGSTVRAMVNGVQATVAKSLEGEPVFNSRRFFLPVTQSGSLTMLGEVTSGTPAALSSVTIVLIGFHL